MSTFDRGGFLHDMTGMYKIFILKISHNKIKWMEDHVVYMFAWLVYTYVIVDKALKFYHNITFQGYNHLHRFIICTLKLCFADLNPCVFISTLTGQKLG